MLDGFKVFVRSITTMVQGGGQIAGLVWGSIQAVLHVCANSRPLAAHPNKTLAGSKAQLGTKSGYQCGLWASGHCCVAAFG